MYEKSFIKRIRNLGVNKVFLSYDFIIGLISFFLIGIYTNWSIDYCIGQNILSIFLQISATIFSLTIAGLAIIISFTDNTFILYWRKIKEFDNLMTIFQYNLYLPLIILLASFILEFFCYSSLGMIALISLFIYMIFSLMQLVQFIIRFGMQKADLIEILQSKEE
jgi:hypothetical protein